MLYLYRECGKILSLVLGRKCTDNKIDRKVGIVSVYVGGK